MGKFRDRVVVVTGGASGIGAALVSEMQSAGARVCVFDLCERPPFLLQDIMYCRCDVSNEAALGGAITQVEASLGQIDIFVSNAGVLGELAGISETSDATWQTCWQVNVMAHVYAARRVLPSMIARKSGYFVNVCSAAGLLNQIGDAAYSATKHAAASFAESLAISHAGDGIGVSLVCPQYVATPLIGMDAAAADQAAGLLSPQQVARSIMHAVRDRRFLVLPHPEVGKYVLVRATDHDRWIKGMTELRDRAIQEFGTLRPQDFYKLV